jgi:hypothetical protein
VDDSRDRIASVLPRLGERGNEAVTQEVIPKWLALVGVVACFLFLAMAMVLIVGWWRSLAVMGLYVVFAVGAYALVRYLERRDDHR